MRILTITNLYPNPLQPLRAPFNRHQLRLLRERTPVHVIAPVAWTDEFRLRRRLPDSIPADRRVPRDGLTVDHPRYWFPPKILRRTYGHCYRASVKRTFRRAVAEFRPDTVFAPWAYPDGWAATRLAAEFGLPCVVQVHGSDVKLLDRHPSRARPTADALARAHGVVAVSRDLATAVENLGVDRRKIRVIYDGVDADLFHPGDRAAARHRLNRPLDRPFALFVGNLVAVKRPDRILHAIASTNADAVFIGEGPWKRRLEAIACQLNLTHRVTFAGGRPQTELPDWYRAADVFVLPSDSEGVPNVLLEASACGTPWVASDVGGIPEILDRGHGRLVPPGDIAALAAAIADAVRSPRPDPVPPRLRIDAVTELFDFLQSVR